jgi:hypothetical protein
MNRPTGVTIIGVLSIIGGILGICAGAAALGLGALVGMGGVAAVGAGDAAAGAAVGGLGALTAVLGIITLVLSIAQLAAGVGLLQLAPWAYRLTVLVTIASIIIAVVNWLAGGGAPIVNLVISGVILWYMNTPDVRNAFNRGTKQLWEA